MRKEQIDHLLSAALNQLQKDGILPDKLPKVQLEPTKDKQHGDYATNIALLLGKLVGRPPRDIASLILKAIPVSAWLTKVEVAGPGFINFFLTANARSAVIAHILQQREEYGRSDTGRGRRVMLEFVSSNPTGPLHVGHGRHGAYGSSVANLLTATGYDVSREYYVNDAGRQMDILAVSVWLRYLALAGEAMPFPANGYRGEYVQEIAAALQAAYGTTLVKPINSILAGLPKDEPEGGDREIYIDALVARTRALLGETYYDQVFTRALDTILEDIRADLAETGVTFDNWFSERAFTRTDAVDRVIALLESRGLTYEQEGALWFRATDYGDEKDRVLRRRNGVRTYFANDLAYHVNKFERGFDLCIDIFGADHHGYIPRMKAGLTACGFDPEKMQYFLVQFVTLYRGGEQVQMSTRSGSFVTLRELRDEVGRDATRFFYLMRKCGQHVDFDLDLAKSHSSDNPVYYIQYAHARICSVFRQLAERQLSFNAEKGAKNAELLSSEHEQQLMTRLSNYPDIVANAAKHFEPQILTAYLRELANDFHACYNACVFLVEEESLRNARLALVAATGQVLKNGLAILLISAPETM